MYPCIHLIGKFVCSFMSMSKLLSKSQLNCNNTAKLPSSVQSIAIQYFMIVASLTLYHPYDTYNEHLLYNVFVYIFVFQRSHTVIPGKTISLSLTLQSKIPFSIQCNWVRMRSTKLRTHLGSINFSKFYQISYNFDQIKITNQP